MSTSTLISQSPVHLVSDRLVSGLPESGLQDPVSGVLGQHPDLAAVGAAVGDADVHSSNFPR
ncbi:hypothetical protein [Mycolicibacterium sp. CR10]|uniref:hypothetical protein n=1 Tax=Mycolicibacterium sp. CR10 TaxID=2562314 RepID=UPI001485AE5F|nr:hypothetical protein [Mycolicibacterium sp. CR10]